MLPIKKTFSRFARGAALILTTSVLAGAAQAEVPPVKGLWAYTGLTSSSGVSMPLTGIFLFADDTFVQQAVFNGEPYYKQSAMAHSGPYRVGEDAVHLVAEQTLSISPANDSPLSSAGETRHELDVTRDGDGLMLVFGSGTVQTFKRLADADDTTVVSLKDGTLAMTDEHLLLVSGNGDYAVTGYGTYRRDGERYFVDVIRWTESDGADTVSARDAVISLHFDGETLRLPNGRVLKRRGS
jgi:hypothetical protein